ncbi:ferric-dicitrate binding protein FerR (iron transport regulator) [Chitinophaga dinghuensis]|uniref:Ferric-dicitrate binding protein FerR (Iron transport regulator) n=1 Tax=Chitinophaga dinghuensis TaxID=1539050 RepID=A0A327WCT3_9BACT|nr:FecR family protein [Chitinophaga dinghuensis]RAJ87712.1 ferric-dicitrate binding protein FerR (iron transport regulator) [Chitinophaga dinghuensis]
MDTEQIKILLERYNQGTCSPEEADIIEKWFENINRQQSIVMEEDALNLQLDEVKLLINEQIAPAPAVTIAPVAKVRKMKPWYTVAAAAVILAAGIFVYRNIGHTANTDTPPHIAANHTKKATRIIRNGFVEVSTPYGLTESFKLEDGSGICMNAGTRIRYPEHFSNNVRNIYLEEGEAVFEVAQNPNSSFVVYSGDLATTALGTAFNIRSYAHEDKITVALINGKVKVARTNNSKESTILMPSEQLNYNRVSLSMIKTSFSNPEAIIGWKKGILVFKNANFDDFATAIRNRFGVTVINHSDKTEWEYNGTFKQGEDLKEVMDVISDLKSIKYTIKNDTVYLKN